MSTHPTQPARRLTIRDIAGLKHQRPIVALTAYTTPYAALLDEHADILLIGDSLGMVLYGMDSTLPVTLDDMIRHTQAVMRGSLRACIITDMPFGTYQLSKEQAFTNATRILKESGAQAVKLEGGEEMAETVRFLTERAIPVMAHIGLKPQHVHQMGGYRYQGRNEAEQQRLRQDATALQQAGAFSLLIEGTDAALSREITASVTIPTIGIGAGNGCDGQILVTEDMLGLSERTPSFVHCFADMRHIITEAARAYADAVKQRKFPADTHSYGVKKTN